MGELRTSFSNPGFSKVVEKVIGVSTDVPSDILITDRPSLAAGSTSSVAFVGSSLTAIIRVMLNPHIQGVLLPRDFLQENVVALLSGTSVFSHCSPLDLTIDLTLHEFVSLVAHGLTKSEAAEKVGYSERHMRRIVGRLREGAGIDSTYPWPILAPLFPR